MTLDAILAAARRQAETHEHCQDAGGRCADALAVARFAAELLTLAPSETVTGRDVVDYVRTGALGTDHARRIAADLLRASEEVVRDGR